MLFLKQRNIFSLKLNSNLPLKRNRSRVVKWSHSHIPLPVIIETWTTFTFTILSTSSQSFFHNVLTQKCPWISRWIFHGPTSSNPTEVRNVWRKRMKIPCMDGISSIPGFSSTLTCKQSCYWFEVVFSICHGGTMQMEEVIIRRYQSCPLGRTWQGCINLSLPCLSLLCKSTHVLRSLLRAGLVGGGGGVLVYCPTLISGSMAPKWKPLLSTLILELRYVF